MATETAPQSETSTGPGNLVEMSWDPITRIVGSLGIYTKIDFDNRRKSSSVTAPRRFFADTASS